MLKMLKEDITHTTIATTKCPLLLILIKAQTALVQGINVSSCVLDCLFLRKMGKVLEDVIGELSSGAASVVVVLGGVSSGGRGGGLGANVAGVVAAGTEEAASGVVVPGEVSSGAASVVVVLGGVSSGGRGGGLGANVAGVVAAGTEEVASAVVVPGEVS